MTVNISKIINYYCDSKGISKNELINFLDTSGPNFYKRVKSNRWLISEVEKLAEFFGLSLCEFLTQKNKIGYSMEAPAPYLVKDKDQQIEGLKKEVEYLKIIVDLYQKNKTR